MNDYRSGVELRPEGVNGRGVKLPLALHQATATFAHYVDRHTLEMVNDSQEYFLNIQQMPREQIRAAIDRMLMEAKTAEPVQNLKTENALVEKPKREFADMPIPSGESSGLRESVESLLRDGLQEKGTRHNAQFLLALFYKEKGVPLEQAVAKISEWIETQWSRGMTNEDDLDFLKSEVKRHVNYVYNNPDYVSLYRGRPPVLTYEDAAWVSSFEGKNLRRVLWAMLMIGRMYHAEGYLFADMNSIASLTGLTRQTASKPQRVDPYRRDRKGQRVQLHQTSSYGVLHVKPS